jgi:hypothetical protein
MPTKKGKRRNSNNSLPNRSRRGSIKRPPFIPKMKNSVYLKGNPVTSVTLPHTLPNITR